MQHIEIKVNNYWKNFAYSLSICEQNILKKKVIFEYSNETTLFDFFKYLNSIYCDIIVKLEQTNSEKINYKRNIRSRYRIIYNKKFLYIYDLNVKFELLIKLFDLSEVEIFFSFFMELGGRLLELNGMEFYMHSNESGRHHLPHIHVRYQGQEVVICLDGKILEGRIKNKYQKLAQEIIIGDKESFLIKWNSLTNGENFRFIKKELIRVDSMF